MMVEYIREMTITKFFMANMDCLSIYCSCIRTIFNTDSCSPVSFKLSMMIDIFIPV